MLWLLLFVWNVCMIEMWFVRLVICCIGLLKWIFDSWVFMIFVIVCIVLIVFGFGLNVLNWFGLFCWNRKIMDLFVKWDLFCMVFFKSELVFNNDLNESLYFKKVFWWMLILWELWMWWWEVELVVLFGWMLRCIILWVLFNWVIYDVIKVEFILLF